MIVSRKRLLLGLLAGLVTSVAFGLGGFFLIYDNSGSMGSTLFLLLPFATGFATALIARGWELLSASLIVGVILCSAVLLATDMEGWVCVLMSAPLIAFGITIGALIGVLVRSKIIQRTPAPRVYSSLVLLVLPLGLLGANNAEETSRRTPRTQTVTNTLTVDAPREVVWNQLKSVDKINASKGFLMRIGLPVPVSCKVEKEEVGGKRTCYFESGYIEERITEWNPPLSMKMEITASDVPGRPWLTFKDASYELSENNGKTTITRRTTIVSRLSPAWYWRRLEKIGVETEHEYLFEEVRNSVSRNTN
ncbi:MAG TPA: hypothetical protein VFH31_13130 [Pyrinomonadaceae bacterium]|nr:hypothetical protein [Pyrinomonadaceae bacterium]